MPTKPGPKVSLAERYGIAAMTASEVRRRRKKTDTSLMKRYDRRFSETLGETLALPTHPKAQDLLGETLKRKS